MKKKYLLLFLLSFLFIGNVNADQNLKCVYGYESSVSFTCTINSAVLSCKAKSATSNLNVDADSYIADIDEFISDLTYYCPEKVFYNTITQAGGPLYTNFSFIQEDRSSSWTLASSEGEGSEVNQNELVDGYCPLGADVTQDLYGALKIFKIVAPILCLSLSIFDVVKTVAQGDADAQLKTVWNRFLKRIGLTVLLYFIPVLVDATLQLINVWDNTGHCVLTDVKDKDLEKDQKTKCYVCKLSGVYYWASYDTATKRCSGKVVIADELNTKQTCVEKSAACYKCGDGYHWYTFYQSQNEDLCPGTGVKTQIAKNLCSTGGLACYKCSSGKAHPDAKLMAYSTFEEFRTNCMNGIAHVENLSEEDCHE